MKRIRLLSACMSLSFILIGLTCCNNPVNEIPVESVSLNRSNLSIVLGDEEQLLANVTPADATHPDLAWLSSDESTVAVGADGTVTAVGVGSATVTVITLDGVRTANCRVTVCEVPIAVTGITLNKSITTIVMGSTEQLAATITPSTATNQDLTWSSSDESRATVSTDGLVSAVAAGSSLITVTTDDGGWSAACMVTVSVEPIAVSGVSLNKVSTAVTVGSSELLTATVTPANATNPAVLWLSSDGTRAAVDPNGLVTGLAAGAVTITVITLDGAMMASCSVAVAAVPVHVTGIALDTTSTSLLVGASEQLTATIAPSDATNQNVGWNSSDPTRATVSSSGLVTALAVGSATITVTTADGGRTAACTVAVALPIAVTGVSLNKSSTTITEGHAEQLSATISPMNATNTSVIWFSTDESKATVSPNGLVSAIAVGTATITAVTIDGGRWASCSVTISSAPIPVSGVSLNISSTTLWEGSTEQLTATVTPSNATNQGVTWSSNAEDKATVSSSGLLTAVAEGSATIMVTTADGGKTASCSVTVQRDSTPPVPGNSGILGVTARTTSTMSIAWSAASDNVTPPGQLTYQVFSSLSNNISTYAACVANGTPAGSWTASTTSASISGLALTTTYYVNVAVRDLSGNISMYSAVSAKTLSNIILINGARQWSDGTFAPTAKAYRNPTNPEYEYSGDVGDGLYWIKPGASAFKAFCDMSTNGGGWTLVGNYKPAIAGVVPADNDNEEYGYFMKARSDAAYGLSAYIADPDSAGPWTDWRVLSGCTWPIEFAVIMDRGAWVSDWSAYMMKVIFRVKNRNVMPNYGISQDLNSGDNLWYKTSFANNWIDVGGSSHAEYYCWYPYTSGNSYLMLFHVGNYAYISQPATAYHYCLYCGATIPGGNNDWYHTGRLFVR